MATTEDARASAVCDGARAVIEAGNPDAARRTLAELARKSPSFARAHLMLAVLCERAGERAEALAACERAFTADPTARRTRHYRTWLKARAAIGNEALTAAEQIAKDEGDSSESLTLLGDVHAAAARWKSAEKAWRKAAGPQPSPALTARIAHALHSQGRTSEARALAPPPLPDPAQQKFWNHVTRRLRHRAMGRIVMIPTVLLVFALFAVFTAYDGWMSTTGIVLASLAAVAILVGGTVLGMKWVESVEEEERFERVAREQAALALEYAGPDPLSA